MEQSKTLSSCLSCPREVGNQYIHDALVRLRDKFAESSQAFLDEGEAREFAVTLHSLGVIEDPADTQAVRMLAAQGFELFDYLEETLDEQREEEKKYCVGALRMRASDKRTQYDVTLCRSPKNAITGNLEQAIVARKTL